MKLLLIVLTAFLLMSNSDCSPNDQASNPVSASGVTKANTSIQTESNGNTVEQNNVIKRLKMDNTPGSIKHLYIMSAYSGQVLLYSTVKGKVTSSGKRLTPETVVDRDGEMIADTYGFNIDIAGQRRRTTEVLGDDGTYGPSIEYLYWFDSKGVYHQQYVTGGMILHISDQPISVKSVTLNLEIQ